MEANSTQNTDLFWALRGGKVGFGVVTEVRLQLVKLEALYAGSLFFEEKDIETALRAWADWTSHADQRVTTSAAIICFPAFAGVPEMFRGRRLLTIRFAFPGATEEGIRLASPLRTCAPVYLDLLDEMPLSAVGRIHNDPQHPISFWASSVLLNRIDQNFISCVLEEIGAGKESPFNAVEIRHLGNATKKDVKEGSSVGGRNVEFTFSMVGKNPQQFREMFAFKADQLITKFGSIASEEGNINLMGNSIEGKHFKSMWAPPIKQRLMEIQRKYNPCDLFV